MKTRECLVVSRTEREKEEQERPQEGSCRV